ncbi:Chalcone synthase 3 [Bienertia sinuspersici]
MENVQEFRNSQRAVGVACIWVLAKLTPPTLSTKRITLIITSGLRTARIKSKILKENPSMLKHGKPSHNNRRAMTIEYVPKLGAEAAERP